ncbi:MAG: translocation/assembly module TamB domain-containing protein [Prevotella sp.]|nr:translocation/assembly module TamB domain-containing protein [Prevotella sp.]
MKILRHILSGLIWSLIALYVLLMTLTHIPAFQTKLANKVATEIGNKLGTKVQMERVNLGFLNRIIIDGFHIYDQQGESLLRVGRLSVRAEWSALLNGRISISSAQLFGAQANLYKTHAEAPANYQFVIDSLASKDTTSSAPLQLRINSLIVRHSSINYHRRDVPLLDRISTDHLSFNNISAHIILKELNEDTLNVNIKRLALNELSGLKLKSLTLKLEAGKKRSRLSELKLQLPESTLFINKAEANYDAKHLKETLRYRVDSLAFGVCLNDLSFLHPSLKNVREVIECKTLVQGSSQSIRIPSVIINSTNNLITLKATGWAEHLDQSHPEWQAVVNQFSMNENTFRLLKSEIPALPEILGNIGNLNIHGRFEGWQTGDMQATSTLTTDIGNLEANFQIDANKAFKGNLTSNGIDLKGLLNNERFGNISGNINIQGDRTGVNVMGEIPAFEYKNYAYQNINLNASLLTNDLLHGDFHQMSATGVLKIDDENIKTMLNGEWKKTGKNMKIKAEGNVRDFSPLTLHLSDKWGKSVFTASFATDITASNLNDAQGSITLYDFAMADSTDVFTIKNVQLTTGFEGQRHHFQVKGDMGTMELNGEFNWDTLPQSFINVLGAHLPTLPGLPPMNDRVTNDFDIKLELYSTRWMQKLLNIPVNLDEPMTLSGSINDTNRNLSITGNIPAFTYKGSSYRNAVVAFTSPSDSILCDISLKKIMDNGTGMDIGLKANASDNRLQTSVNWNNHAKGRIFMQGNLNAITQLYSDHNRKAQAHIHIQPSHITMGAAKWDVLPSDIFYSEKKLIVDEFSVKHEQQHLTIDGVASASPTDTLAVDMKEMDVGYIMELINFHPVEFNGLATGKVYATQLFERPIAWTNLTVDQFTFENGRMGTLYANAQWNNERQQIDIDAKTEDGPEVMTLIDGYVSPVRKDIDLNIRGRGTHIEFLKTYTSSFLKNIEGHAYGDLKLVGPLGKMDLIGTLVADGQADVIPLGTTYKLVRDTVHFVHNDIRFNKAAIYDKYGNTASISGGIHHEHLSNMTFDLDIETQRMLAYDFKEFGDEQFCGSVVASGHVDMHGRPKEVTINIDATPLLPTTFFYNASSGGSVSSQEFITWRDKGKASTTEEAGEKESKVKDIPSDLFLNFRINANSDATVRLLMDAKMGDYITLNGSGMIRASYHNKGAFHMFGTYQVERGTYGITIQNIIKKNFKFKEGGTIVFGGAPMEANLQLQAIHTVNGVSLSDLNLGNSFSNNTVRVNCLMNILGQAGAPRIEFDLDIPNVNSEEKQMIRSVITSEQEMNQQVLYLLGIGRFYTQDINNASSQTYDQTQLAMQSFLSGTLSTQINEVISHVVKNDNWNFGANISTGNEGWHNAEYEGIVSGRMLNNRLLINGQFGYRDNATRANHTFIGDFDIRYLLRPNGNLALKVYNQTNDRYFTRSSLNTQGIGFIIKRDFDGIGDLFSRKKKRQ